jgi:hypothetical protein
MKLAQIENGVVTNIIKVDPANVPDWARGWPTAEEVRIGQLYDGNAFSDPTPEPLPDPLIAWRQSATLSRAQFCVAVKRLGLLSSAEAKAAAKGEWPQTFADALSNLPSAIDPDEAEIVWAAVSVVDRNDPVLAAVAVDKGVSDAQLDAMFGWVG